MKLPAFSDTSCPLSDTRKGTFPTSILGDRHVTVEGALKDPGTAMASKWHVASTPPPPARYPSGSGSRFRSLTTTLVPPS